LEATTIGEKELYHLMEIEENTLEPLMTTLVPFLVIKQSLANEETLARELEDARRELAKHRAMEKPEIPVDVRLAESEGQITALREELERVSRELKAATDRERGLNAELSKLRREVKKKDAEIVSHKSDKKELAELREALYSISQSQEDNQESGHESGEIVFPYNDLPEGIVCFGGHEQWIGQMQKKLPGVRFVPVNYRYDSSIVKRAPCVWIQPCYLSHKMYFRIIGDARSVGVERHYFHSLSASSSARHLVLTMRRE